MEIRQLRYFIAAAEAGSVSRAAERCQIAQPSLSQQLRRLEESLGVELFDRLGRGIALTDAGRALLPRARRIVSEVDDAAVNLMRATEVGGALTIGAIPTMAPYILPPALSELRTALPEVELTIQEATTEDVVDLLLATKIDCAVLSTPLDHELLDVQVVGHDELVLIVPPDHALAGRLECGWAAVRGQPTITLHDMHCLSRQIDAFCAARNPSLRTVCRSTQLASVFALVASGIGISIVPEMAAAQQPEGRFSFVRLAQHKPVRQVAIAWRHDRTRPRAGELVASIIAEQLSSGMHRLPLRPTRGT